MHLEVEITAQPIEPRRPVPPELAGALGALAEFTGVVRGQEDGQPIAALEYEAYEPMAEKVMRAIIEDLRQRHPCAFVRVTHRVGIVPVGETAIHVAAAAPHRAAALALVTEFMDRLKQDVPIWKRRALRAGEVAAAR